MVEDRRSIIYVALELSRSGWLVAILPPGEARASRYKIEAGGRDRLLQLLARARALAERRLGARVQVRSCYEAGYEGFWLHRVLAAVGVASHVVDPSSLQVNRRARRAKSDGIDVERILRALIAWDHGERDQARMVVVPPPEIEDDRRISRERGSLIRERTRQVNRVKGLLAAVGVYGFEPRTPGAADRLAGLVTGDGRMLPAPLVAEIRRDFDEQGHVPARRRRGNRPQNLEFVLRHGHTSPAERVKSFSRFLASWMCQETVVSAQAIASAAAAWLRPSP